MHSLHQGRQQHAAEQQLFHQRSHAHHHQHQRNAQPQRGVAADLLDVLGHRVAVGQPLGQQRAQDGRRQSGRQRQRKERQMARRRETETRRPRQRPQLRPCAACPPQGQRCGHAKREDRHQRLHGGLPQGRADRGVDAWPGGAESGHHADRQRERDADRKLQHEVGGDDPRAGPQARRGSAGLRQNERGWQGRNLGAADFHELSGPVAASGERGRRGRHVLPPS